jgi:mannonate dehydratase
VPSEYSGITMCQGTLATVGEDIPSIIRKFASQNKIFFVHFRDVRGTPDKFEETFHDDGKTDMLEAMKTYYEVGFKGPARPDHVPTMEGEDNDNPGYELLGRLYGVGYIKGLMEAVAVG